jgi:hypothetical protein
MSRPRQNLLLIWMLLALGWAAYRFLKDNAGVSVFDCKVDDLLPKPNKKIKDGIQSAELVLVTSQEIDELCEADNIAQARLQMDGVLGQLRRGVRILSDLGIKTIILVADHGHLFADERRASEQCLGVGDHIEPRSDNARSDQTNNK